MEVQRYSLFIKNKHRRIGSPIELGSAEPKILMIIGIPQPTTSLQAIAESELDQREENLVPAGASIRIFTCFQWIRSRSFNRSQGGRLSQCEFWILWATDYFFFNVTKSTVTGISLLSVPFGTVQPIHCEA